MIEKFNPRNSAAWHKLRSRDITASVAGALIGVHEFVTPFELWALKSGRLEEDPEESPAIKRGRLLEPVAVQLLRELRPTWDIVHNTGNAVTYYRDREARLGATPDVFAVSPERGPGIVQIKSVERSTFRRKWLQEDGSVQPPLWIAIQAIIEAHLTGAEWAAVAPLVVGHGIELPIIDIPLIDGVIDRIKDETRAFWQMVESGEEPTPDYSRDGDVIERIYSSDAGEEIDLSLSDRIEELVALRKLHHDAANEHDLQLGQAVAEIKALMKGASVAYLKGGRTITWKRQRRAGPDGRATVFRVLRVPEPL